MMHFLRGKTASTVLKIFMLLLGGSFVLWGIGDVFRQAGGNPVVANVGSQTILKSQLDAATQQQLQTFSAQFGGKEVPDFLRKTLERTTLLSLVQRALLLEEARTQHLTVSESELLDVLKGLEIFRKDGRFNRDMFQEFLRYRQLDEASFLRQLKDDVVVGRLVDVWQAAPEIPDIQLQLQHRYQNEQRTLRLATLDAAALPDPAAPKDEVLAAWLKKHQNDYQSEERRSFRYLLLSPANLTPDAAVSEEEITRTYNENKAAYETGEQFELNQLVLSSDEADADGISEALQKGTSLEELRKTHPSLPADWLKLGTVAPASLPDAALAELEGLKVGGISAPVQTDFATVIYQLKGKSPSRQQTLDEVKESIRQQLQQDKLQTALEAKTAEVEDRLAGGDKLDAVAAALKLPLVEVPLTNAELTDQPNSPRPAAEKLKEVTELAFTLEKDEEPEAQEVEGLGTVFVELTKIEEAQPLPLEKVKPAVLTQWIAEEKSRQLKAKADAAQAEINEQVPFDTLIGDYGFKPGKDATLTRTDLSHGLSAECLDALFSYQPGEIRVLCETGIDAYALAEVKSVTPAEAPTPEALEKLKKQSQTLYARELFDHYLRYLERKHGVTYAVIETE